MIYINFTYKKDLKIILRLYPKLCILIQKAKLLGDTKDINILKYFKSAVGTCINSLNSDDKMIIKNLFFKHGQFTAVYVSLKLHTSRATVYNHINKFLNQLSLLIPFKLAKKIAKKLSN